MLRFRRDEKSRSCQATFQTRDAREHRGLRRFHRTHRARSLQRRRKPLSLAGLGRTISGRNRLLRRTAPLRKKPRSRREPHPQSARPDGHAGRRPATAKPAERLENFLEDLTLDSDREEEKENTGDAVTLITMHSCKGLEFPHVFIVGLEDGLLPHSRSKAEGTLDEERRLFYVAVTRAMQTLTISHCAGRKKYGQLMPCHPSPFLKELPPELVEQADEKASHPSRWNPAKTASTPSARHCSDLPRRGSRLFLNFNPKTPTLICKCRRRLKCFSPRPNSQRFRSAICRRRCALSLMFSARQAPS